MLDNIKSKYILKEVFMFIQEKTILQLIKHNKRLQKDLDISIKDYKEYNQIEIIIKLKDLSDYNIKRNFLNIKEKYKAYIHAFIHKQKDKIKIIPQGFNMRDLKLYNGPFEGTVKIAYAGVFYWDIRNPEFLFRYLNTCKVDYEFYLYMRFKDAQFDVAMERYPNFAKRVKVSYGVPHDELIYKLSEMDFLINIENVSNTQMPSKLIDYGMTKRPIFSCKEATFSPQKMDRFLFRDYTGSYEVDIENYNVEKIVQQFLELYKSVSR